MRGSWLPSSNARTGSNCPYPTNSCPRTCGRLSTAEQYGRQPEGLLAQGIVPAALVERDQSENEIWTVHRCIAEYLRHNPVPLSDQKLLKAVMPSLEKISIRFPGLRLGRRLVLRHDVGYVEQKRPLNQECPALRSKNVAHGQADRTRIPSSSETTEWVRPLLVGQH